MATMTTVTDEQIERLANEAAENGDTVMVEYCRAALDESIRTSTRELSDGTIVSCAGARQYCTKVILEALAQQDDDEDATTH